MKVQELMLGMAGFLLTAFGGLLLALPGLQSCGWLALVSGLVALRVFLGRTRRSVQSCPISSFRTGQTGVPSQADSADQAGPPGKAGQVLSESQKHAHARRTSFKRLVLGLLGFAFGMVGAIIFSATAIYYVLIGNPVIVGYFNLDDIFIAAVFCLGLGLVWAGLKIILLARED